MNYRSVAAKVADQKQKHPERYCPKSGCLWRTNGGTCPRHTVKPAAPAKANVKDLTDGERAAMSAYDIRILESLDEETL